MHADEKALLRAIATRPAGASVRDVVNDSDTHHKRCWYLLGKWLEKGWYDYGVSLDLGWLTPAGEQAARELEAT